MLNHLFYTLQSWFESGMPLGASSASAWNEWDVLEDDELPVALRETSSLPSYSMVSHQNVYHPRRADTLLLRSGQTVSTSLLQKLCQFGIDVADFCSLKEKQSGALHPITEETIAWLPASHQILKKTAAQHRKAFTNKTAFLGLTLPTTEGVTAPVRKRFEETLKALKACPMPNLLVLNPLPREQRKLGKLLEAIGVEYQQIQPVLTLVTLPYMLRKYQPQTLMIDEACWQTNPKLTTEDVLQNMTILIDVLSQELRVLQAQQAVVENGIHLLFVLTPQTSQRGAVVNALTKLNTLATVKVLWKPCKRPVAKEALKSFIQITDVQLERRQEVQSFVR